jgi:hypothetical protein
MHCPQCGQEQISGEMRFCKSCGFRLDGVKELLAADGVSAAREKESRDAGQSPRRRGIRLGVILLFISIVFMPVGVFIGEPRGPALPAIFFMAGLMRILYAVIFQAGAAKKRGKDSYSPQFTTDQLGTATPGTALPPSRSAPVGVFNPQRMDAAELVSPPSVTERTTNLLDKSLDRK